MSADRLDRSRGLEPAEHLACLGLGSNVEPERNLPRALGRLGRALAVDAVSSAWESPAVGMNGPDFVNAALLVRTRAPRERLTAVLKEIERDLGRDRTQNQATLIPIDIDLLIFDGEVLEEDLWDKAYRAVTVAELLPGLAHPSTGESLSQIASRLATTLPIELRPEIVLGPPAVLDISDSHD